MKRRTGEGEKREAARAWGGGFMREKASRRGTVVGGAPGPALHHAPWGPRRWAPKVHRARNRKGRGGSHTGRARRVAPCHPCQAPLPVASTTPKNGGGVVRSSQPHSVDSQRTNGTPASIPSALLPSNCKTNANTQPSLAQPDPLEFLTSDESESGRRRKQFASSSQVGAKCKNS